MAMYLNLELLDHEISQMKIKSLGEIFNLIYTYVRLVPLGGQAIGPSKSI